MYLVEDCGHKLVIYDEDEGELKEIGRADGKPLPLSAIRIKLDVQESWSKLDEGRFSGFLSGGKY